jgi:hypothetical protein
MELQGPAINVGGLKLLKAKGSTKGPFINVTIDKNGFYGQFDAFVDIPYIVKVGIAVTVSPKAFTFTAYDLQVLIFPTIDVMTCQLEFEPKPRLKEIEMQVNVKKIGAMIQMAANLVRKPIKKFMHAVSTDLRKLKEMLASANKWLKAAQAKIEEDKSMCPSASFTPQQAQSCMSFSKIEPQCQSASHLAPFSPYHNCNWYWGKYYDYAKFEVCKLGYKAYDGAAHLLCEGFFALLSEGEKILAGGVHDLSVAVAAAQKLWNDATNMADGWLNWLASVQLKALGFTVKHHPKLDADFYVNYEMGSGVHKTKKTSGFTVDLSVLTHLSDIVTHFAEKEFDEVKNKITTCVKNIVAKIEGKKTDADNRHAAISKARGQTTGGFTGFVPLTGGCGTQEQWNGNLNGNNAYTGLTLQGCERKCRDTTNCMSFGYQISPSQCWIKSTCRDANGNQRTNKGLYPWRKSCLWIFTSLERKHRSVL